MRLSERDETVAVYDRILRLIASIDVTLNDSQKNELIQWLLEATSRHDEQDRTALQMFVNLVRLYQGQEIN